MEIILISEIILFFFFLQYKKETRNKYFFFTCLILFILTGLHDGQENCDFPQYMNFFTGKDYSMYGNLDKEYELELPYYYYCKFISFFGRTEFIYIEAICFTFGIPFMYMIYKYSKNPPLSLLLMLVLMGGKTYLFYLAGHRQMIATICFILAYLLIESKINRKRIYCIILLSIALMAHSSSFFLLPILLIIYYSKKNLSKKTYIIFITVTLVLGVLLSSLWLNNYNDFMSILNSYEQVERATQYSGIKGFVSNTNVTVAKLIPLSILTISVVLLGDNKEINGFHYKCLVAATCLFNLFSSAPLMDRALTVLFLFGVAGAVPYNLKRSIYKGGVFICALLLNMYFAYSWYISDDFRLDFNFIWN